MLVLTHEAYEDVLEHAQDDIPREACGILAGRRSDDRWLVQRALRLENVATTPRITYAFDPEEQFAVMETLEEHGQSVVGFYHSHPAGPQRPSETDHDRATWTDHYYLIVSLARRPPVLDAWRWTGEEFELADLSVRSADSI